MKPIDRHIFGPVPSRRLGLSLGIDLVPPKTCTYDCIYCQVGKTTKKTIECREFFPVHDILEELKNRLSSVTPDVLTFSGSGEPTLYSKIDELIYGIRRLTNKKITLLTNGSLLWKDDVMERILDVDIIMPTITTQFEDTFNIIHKPHPELTISKVTEGLIRLRQEFRGKIYLELFVLAGINDNEKELLALKEIVGKIFPDKIQINTVVRPPSDKRALAVDIQRLKEIKDLFGDRAEIIADRSTHISDTVQEDKIEHILGMIKRRPVRDIDIANALGIDVDEVQSIIKGLLIKGMVLKYDHLGETYYKGRVRYEE